VDGGVSSGNAALELAINLGAKNIHLAGIDMVMVDGRTHTEGTQVEFNIEKSKSKWSEVATNDGSKATTIPVWERCRNEYVQSIDKHRSKGQVFEVINTAAKGAVIPLTTYKTFDQVENVFDKEINITERIETHRKKLTHGEIEAFKKKLVESTKKLKEYLEICKVAEGLAFDSKRTAEREIAKMTKQIYTSSTQYPYDMVRNVRHNQPNLEKLWTGVVEAYDLNFKQKCYNDMLFRVLIFDVLQLNIYQYENQCAQLINNCDFSDERYFQYGIYTRDFLVTVMHYIEMFITLFEGALEKEKAA
jgi:hypothetical protein